MEIWDGELRDVGRIQLFCDRLVAAWAKLSDWRFGQLMVNLMQDYEAEHGREVRKKKYAKRRTPNRTCGQGLV